MHKIYEAAAEGSSSWTLGEYAVSIRSDLRSTANSNSNSELQLILAIFRTKPGRIMVYYTIQ